MSVKKNSINPLKGSSGHNFR